MWKIDKKSNKIIYFSSRIQFNFFFTFNPLKVMALLITRKNHLKNFYVSDEADMLSPENGEKFINWC